jgi:hypothetical protein
MPFSTRSPLGSRATGSRTGRRRSSGLPRTSPAPWIGDGGDPQPGCLRQQSGRRAPRVVEHLAHDVHHPARLQWGHLHLQLDRRHPAVPAAGGPRRRGLGAGWNCAGRTPVPFGRAGSPTPARRWSSRAAGSRWTPVSSTVLTGTTRTSGSRIRRLDAGRRRITYPPSAQSSDAAPLNRTGRRLRRLLAEAFAPRWRWVVTTSAGSTDSVRGQPASHPLTGGSRRYPFRVWKDEGHAYNGTETYVTAAVDPRAWPVLGQAPRGVVLRTAAGALGS